MLWPPAQDATDTGKQRGRLDGFPFEQCPHVRTGHRPRTALTGNLGDLPESESEATGLRDERQDAQHDRWINAIAGWGPSGNDAPRFVQTQGLATDAAAPRHLTDEQAVCHGDEDRPCRIGQGQGFSSWRRARGRAEIDIVPAAHVRSVPDARPTISHAPDRGVRPRGERRSHLRPPGARRRGSRSAQPRRRTAC